MSINFELLDLRAFLAVYDLASFHKGAELLHLSQPALSRRVQALEATLKVSLLERSTRHVAPTAAGRRFEPMARRLLEELDTALTSISDPGQQSGQITIASLPSAAVYFLPRLIRTFSKRYPLIRLRVLDRLVLEGFECVLRGEAEFGINVNDPTETDLNFLPLLDDPYVFVCHHDHALARKRRVTWEDLSTHPMIGIGRAADSGNRALLDDLLGKASLKLNWLYEVYNFTTALRLIEAGLGASIMPRLGSQRDCGTLIKAIPIGPKELTRSVGIVERRKGRLSPPAQYLRDALIAECAGATQRKTSTNRYRVNRVGSPHS